MIKVNGVVIPTPTDLTPSIMDLSHAERNARGTVIIERIATKRKLEMSWNYMSKENLSMTLKLVSTVFFQVEYLDPQDDIKKTGTFYVGDRKMPILDCRNGKVRYKDIGFNFIER